MDEQTTETASHLLAVSDMIARFAKGYISYEEYREKLDAWWENNKVVWQENDYPRLFRLLCRTS